MKTQNWRDCAGDRRAERRLGAALWALALGGVSVALGQGGSMFATRVVSYVPGPGVPGGVGAGTMFGDPSRALGAPVGGGVLSPDNGKVVSLGGWVAGGGGLVLGFDGPIVDQPASAGNVRGADFIVFGNAFYVGGDVSRRFAEAGIIEISRDANGNGMADDAWFVIPGSHADGARAGVLPGAVFVGFGGQPIVANPLGPEALEEGVWGFADCTPSMVLGDIDGDGVSEAPGLDAAWFYTVPDDSRRVGVSRFSGGGDAIDIASAVDAATGALANLASVDFVRIRTGVSGGSPLLGVISTEISGVAKVLPGGRARADVAGANQAIGPDGTRTADDIIVFLSWYFAANGLADVAGANQSDQPDGAFSADDVIVYLSWYFGQ
jgi:hypothetical protein